MGKDKKHFCCCQDDIIHIYKACIYVLVPQQERVVFFDIDNPWIKTRMLIVENENEFKKSNF